MHHVIEHVHERDTGLYRVVIGVPVTAQVPDYERMQIEHSEMQQTLEDYERAVVEASVNQQELPDPPDIDLPFHEREAVVAYENVEDIVFAADDARWEGKSAHEIAKLQYELVATALAEREQPEPPRDVVPMPGAGGPLAP